MPAHTRLSVGVELIHFERVRQLEEEGYAPEHDHRHHRGEQLALAAACYAMPAHFREHDSWWNRSKTPNQWTHFRMPRWWPFGERFWKPTPDDRIRELVKAGALIAAEIDRLHQVKAQIEAEERALEAGG